MKNELLEKIIDLSKLDSPTEAETQHLFTSTRKLIEHDPAPNRPEYSTLKLYCDWTVHTAIDRSSAGALMLEKINEFVHKVVHGGGTNNFSVELSHIFSLQRVRDELNRLLESEGLRHNRLAPVSGIKWFHTC